MPLTLENVSHRYQRGPAVLDDLNLEVDDQDTVAVLGPSGSGKTTLLAVIGLLLTPTAGSVRVNGVQAPVRGAERHRLRTRTFAWVFQSVNVLGRRKAVDNVAIPLLARGLAREEAEERAASALRLVGLGKKLESPAESLSGGELQRVCIARALASKPPVVLADEPTGQLDRRTSDAVLDAMWDLLNDVRATLIVATHDANVARRCKRVFLLRDGRLEDRSE